MSADLIDATNGQAVGDMSGLKATDGVKGYEAMLEDIRNFDGGLVGVDAPIRDAKEAEGSVGESKHFDGNFHANVHFGNVHSGNVHSGNIHRGENIHCGNVHSGNIHCGNVHSGNIHSGNVHSGNVHSGNVHSGNVHSGNVHSGNVHSGNVHRGNVHRGDVNSSNVHRGNVSPGNVHSGNVHSGNVHSGNVHSGNVHSGNVHSGNVHRGNVNSSNVHSGNVHRGNVHSGTLHVNKSTNLHAGKLGAFEGAREDVGNHLPGGCGSSTISTSIKFFTSCTSDETPFNCVEQPKHGPFNNLQAQTYSMQVEEIGRDASSFSVDTHGFQCVVNSIGPVQGHYDFTDKANIEETLYPKVEEFLLKNLEGAEQVLLYDHTVRLVNGDRGPVTQAHIDQTPASAVSRVWRHLSPSQAMKVTKEDKRVRLINVWLPINGVVESYPLAFADTRTVEDSDLVAVEHRYPTWTGEIYVVKHNENQRWYTWTGMQDGDALLLCCYDGGANKARCAHAAVPDPRSSSHAKPRESIEVRALIIG